MRAKMPVSARYRVLSRSNTQSVTWRKSGAEAAAALLSRGEIPGIAPKHGLKAAVLASLLTAGNQACLTGLNRPAPTIAAGDTHHGKARALSGFEWHARPQ